MPRPRARLRRSPFAWQPAGMPPRASAAEKGKGKALVDGGAAAQPKPQSARQPRADEEAAHDARAASAPSVRADAQARAQRTRVRTGHAGVSGDAALVSRGPFAALDVELTCRIFCFLGTTTDVLRCVLTVCKGWRALRQQPELWRRLLISAPTFDGAGLCALTLGGLRCPLPDASCVLELRIDGGSAVDARSFKAVLARLDHAHTVSLRGKKLTPDCVAVLAKPRPAPLKSLELGKIAKAVDETVLSVLGAHSASLLHLSCELDINTAWVAAAARCAPPCALETLRLCEPHVKHNQFFCGSATLAAVARLGDAFPMLTSLVLADVQSVDDFHPPAVPMPAWAPLPALRELRVLRFGIPMVPQLNSERLAAVAGCIAAAAPQLRVLHLSRGEQISTELFNHATAVFRPLPSFGMPALAGLGSLLSLEELHLEFMALTAADVAGSHLPALRTLNLKVCGTRVTEAAAALAAAAPALESLTINGLYCTDLDGTTGPGVAGLSTLRAPALRSLTLDSGSDTLFVASSRAEHDTGADVAAAVRDLAVRGACPALHRLEIAAPSPYEVFRRTQPTKFPACFDAAAPWPELRELVLRLEAGDVPASLAALHAPALEELVLRSTEYDSAAVTTAVDQMRAQGRAPRLRPLQAPGAAPAAAAEQAGGAGGSVL